MKSIRLSLMLYFLGLLALGLGAVSLLVYHTTQQTLLEKKEATEQLLETQYAERCTKERERVNSSLQAQAIALSNVVDFVYKPGPYELGAYGMISQIGNPTFGRITAALWVPPNWAPPQAKQPVKFFWERPPMALGWEFHEKYYKEYKDPSERKFNDDVLDLAVDREVADFCQINTLLGPTYRSPKLRQDHRSLPYDPVSAPNRIIGSEVDELSFEGTHLRRVTLTLPYPRFFPFRYPSSGRGGRGQDDKDKAPPQFNPTMRPTMFVQCAVDTSRMEANLADLAERHEEEKARLAAATNASLASLRNTLLAIVMVTFAGTAIGGLVLVRIGLAPLGRLSDAVSQVSEKDFHLHLGKSPLPEELDPIALRLSQTLDELKQAFQREKQVAADISHELRTPLAALMTTIEVCLRKARQADVYRETLEECRTNGQQMSRLVERLLVLARLDAGVDPLRPRQVDVADLAEQCATMVRPLAEANALQLTVSLPGPTPLNADADKLREVLSNLLHNAIQYNRQGGRVELSVARHNGSVRMEVRDTGIGISPENRIRIFERFYRADPSRHTDGLNSGLGLALVKGYVDLMGGTIAVESTPGEGSTFRVELPVHKA